MRFHIDSLVAVGVLGGSAGRAVVGVAAASLDATEGEHHWSRHVACICAEREFRDAIKARNQFPTRHQSHLATQVGAHQWVLR